MTEAAEKPAFDNVIAVPFPQQTSDIPAKIRRSRNLKWQSHSCLSRGRNCLPTVTQILLICLLIFALAPSKTVLGAEPVTAGPLFYEFGLTLTAGHRTEALGPLFYSEQREKQRIWAIPPLVSYARDPETDTTEFDILYPVVTYDRYGTQYRWQIFQLLNMAGGPNQREPNRDRFSIFPFYFQQRSSIPSENYTAVAPFYGHLKNHFFRDEISFVMFPFYSETRKKDVITDNYVYPFFHLRRGDGLRGWQLWPFVGQEHKEVTTRTNNFNQVETIGGREQSFVLWPFFTTMTSDIGTEELALQQNLLPFYSVQRSAKRDQTTILWPFFSRIDDREKQYREWQFPWPLIVFARGEGKTTSRVLPFFSVAHSPTLESDSYLWPIYKFNRTHADLLDRQRTRILLFLYSDTRTTNTQTRASQQRVDFWPFYHYWRDFNGNSRFQVLSVLEPYLAGSHKIERDYSHVWSVWRAEKNARTGAASQSLLWNLYRRETSPAFKKCSLLFGLFQYQSGNEGKRLRLLYLPVLKEGSPPPKLSQQ